MIICGDALTELRKLDSNSIDCVITSPPYNLKGIRGGNDLSTLENRKGVWKQVSVNYDIHDDNMPEDVYWEWQVELLNECRRVIKPTGSVFYNHKNRRWRRQTYSPLPHILKSDLMFYQEIVWDRFITPALSNRMLFPFTERIYWFVKDSPKVFKKALPKEFRGDVWRIYPCKRNQHKSTDWRRPEHPAPFPEELVENCILLTTEPDDVVLDPYIGSGTVGVAAQKHNRKYIGIELSKEYCQFAERRIESARGHPND